MTRTKGRRGRYQGIFVSMPTPCNEKFEVNIERFKEHVSRLIDEGLVEGKAVLMGGVGGGESYFLRKEEHVNIMKALVDVTNGKVGTCTGVFLSNTREAIERARIAADIGIDLIQMNPPHYLKPCDEEVYTHYRMMNDAVDIGIMVYNTPWAAMGYELRAPIISKLIELDNVVGFKWMSLDTDNYLSVLHEFSRERLFVDNSYHTSVAYRLGARGFISSLANIAPKLELGFLELLESKDYVHCDDSLHSWWWEFGRFREADTAGEGTYVKALYEAAGLPMGPPFPPQRRASKEEIRRLRRILEEKGILKYAYAR